MITSIVGSFGRFQGRPKHSCIVRVLVLCVLLCQVRQAAAYIPLTLNSGASAGTVFRWDLSSLPNGAIPYSINPVQPAGLNPIGPPGITNAQTVDAIRAAFQSWENVSTSQIRYHFIGETTATNGMDLQNVVTFSPQGFTVTPQSSPAFTTVFAALSAGPVSIPGGPTIIANFAGQILDMDIVVNLNWNYVSSITGPPPSGTLDLQGVVTHEVGHLSGLDHVCIQSTTMACTGNDNFSRRTLKQDDAIGISTLYPGPGFLSSTGEISGTVTRSDGRPVFGAHVVAIDAGTGIVVASAVTGLVETAPNGMPLRFSQTSGNYLLTGLPPGSYVILAEPMDGPPAKSFLGGIFGNYSDKIFVETDFMPGFSSTPVAVAPGQTTSGIGVSVGVRSSLSPNLPTVTWSAVSGQPFINPAIALPGASPLLSVGYGENIVAGSTLVPGTTFQFSGDGISIGTNITVRSTDILVPIVVSPTATIGPRLLTVTTPNGISSLAGGVTIVSTQLDHVVFSAVLPSSRSVQVGVPATAFATIINAGSDTIKSCGISNMSFIPANFDYQTTDPATNAVVGSPNSPVDIAAGAFQTYILSFIPTSPFAPTDVQMSFNCANAAPAPIITGLNTLLLSASATPVPDIVALAATTTNDGIVNVSGTNGAGAFAVATVNVGASGSITASADTGNASLPVNIFLCQTDPANGQCISGIGPSVTTTINANATPTFGIFVQGNGDVPFDPAANRIFVRFKDGGGVTRGSTSVAVRTQ
jgi:matrixin